MHKITFDEKNLFFSGLKIRLRFQHQKVYLYLAGIYAEGWVFLTIGQNIIK